MNTSSDLYRCGRNSEACFKLEGTLYKRKDRQQIINIQKYKNNHKFKIITMFTRIENGEQSFKVMIILIAPI